MTVYFAQTRIDPTKVKIGFTSNLEARRVNMSVSVPGGISIMATIHGGKETEQYLHDKFSSDNIGGEWFTLSDDLSGFIRDVQNGKQGLVPFVDDAEYMVRSTAEYSQDALEVARQMAVAILDREYRGVGDTLDAAMHRVEARHGIKRNLLKRLRYRGEKSDIWAGEYLHVKSVYEQQTVRDASRQQHESRVAMRVVSRSE
jgi:hypothetical protein